MGKIVLNKYSYTLENMDSNKVIHINEIVSPSMKVVSTTQNPGSYGESYHQRSVLEEVYVFSGVVDYENHVYSSKNPVCEKLLSFEKELSRLDAFEVVVNHKERKTIQRYKILSKKLRKDY